MNQDIRKLRNKSQAGDRLRDPVCGMQVASDQHAIMYQQMHFAFRSVQCRERFLANPHLYIGHSGHKAPAQEGRTVLYGIPGIGEQTSGKRHEMIAKQ